MNRFWSTSVERFDTALPLLATAPIGEAQQYLEWSAGNGSAKQVDDACKWAELLHSYGYLSDVQFKSRIRALQDRLHSIIPTRCSELDIGVDRSAYKLAIAEHSLLQRRPIVIVANSVSPKVDACVRALLELGMNSSALHAYLCPLRLTSQKPYHTADRPWYESPGDDVPATERLASVKFEPLGNIWELLPRVRMSASVLLIFGMPVLSPAFISAFPGNIVNGHNGPLPEVRGLDSPGWCRLQGIPFACTVHQISREIDAGDLLARRTIADGTKRSFDIALAQEMAASAWLLSCELPGVLSNPIQARAASYFTTMSVHTREVLDQVALSSTKDRA